MLDATAAGRVSLAEFRREVRVPLELDIMSCPNVNRSQPGQLVSGLLGALPGQSAAANDPEVSSPAV